MILYHGSKSGIKGEICIDAGRATCDFGAGFYMGDRIEQPISLVSAFEGSKLYTLEFDMEQVKKKLIFDESYESQIDWAMYVAYNRGIGNLSEDKKLAERYQSYNKEYELVVGLIADDKMTQVLNRFYAGDLCDKAMLEALQFVKLGKQYVVKSNRLCKQVKIKEFHDLTASEKKLGAAMTNDRNMQTSQIVAQMQAKYRRAQDVKYFDEIIREWSEEWN